MGTVTYFSMRSHAPSTHLARFLGVAAGPPQPQRQTDSTQEVGATDRYEQHYKQKLPANRSAYTLIPPLLAARQFHHINASLARVAPGIASGTPGVVPSTPMSAGGGSPYGASLVTCSGVPPPPYSDEKSELRIVTLGSGTAAQRKGLERWKNPKLARRTCECEYGLQYIAAPHLIRAATSLVTSCRFGLAHCGRAAQDPCGVRQAE